MTSEESNPADRQPQYSLRQLWLVVSVCGALFTVPLFTVPLFAALLVWLFVQLGVAAAVLLALVALQAPGFLLFKTLWPHETSENEPANPKPQRGCAARFPR